MRYFFWICSFFYAFCIFSSDIAVVTLAIGETYQEAVSLAIENKRSYCQQQGYDFICGKETYNESLQPGWSKILILLELMGNSEYKWIFWTDADSLFMNFDHRLEDLIDENYNLLITQDMFTISTGHFFIRNCEWSRQFLLDVYSRTECHHHYSIELQPFVLEMRKLERGPLVKVLPQKRMNSYPIETISFLPSSMLLPSVYTPGDFIVHFSGEHRPNKLRTLLEDYSKKVIKE